jgi:non-homologous end joining protein Ku
MTTPEPEPSDRAADRTDAPPEAVELMAALKASLDKAKAARTTKTSEEKA